MLKLSPSGSSGCAAKIRAQDLLRILNKQSPEDLSILSPDGERLSAFQSLYSTIDTISPITKNPEAFGSIAVSHALNDLHVLGVKPTDACISYGLDKTTVLNGDAKLIMDGTNKALFKNKVKLCNAHSYSSHETAITVTLIGIRRKPSMVMEKKEKYTLILTKELGAATTCRIASILSRTNPISQSENVMNQHHLSLLKPLTKYCHFGSTDISGFGLIGHLIILARSRGCKIEIDTSQIPFINGISEFESQIVQDCSAQRNQTDFEDLCCWKNNVKGWRRLQLYSAETAGPLLCIISEDVAVSFINLLYKQGFSNARRIGSITISDEPDVILL
jgi:selenide,water dikinase